MIKPKPYHVCLTGMMGSGKTWVGAELASLLGWPWMDLDLEIERRMAMSVAEIFDTMGESFFRETESRCLKDVLALPPPTVVSLGGGTVLDAFNRDLLVDSAMVVFLRATSETLVESLVSDSSRPLLRGDLSMKVETLLQQRGPLYLQASNFVVDVDGKDAHEISTEIIQGLSLED